MKLMKETFITDRIFNFSFVLCYFYPKFGDFLDL